MAKLRRFGATSVSEGVRLEVGKYTVFAVRNEQRDIAVRVRREPRKVLRALMTAPLLRGAVRLVRDVVRFFDGLGEGAELRPQRPVRGTRPEQFIAGILHIRPQTIATLLSALIMIPLVLALLWAAPLGAKLLLQRYFALPRLQMSLIVAVVRVLGLLAGVTIVCRLRVFKRLCMYKGAINKVINCYENREEVNTQSAAGYPIVARRSEPAFLLCVLCVAIVLFALIRPRGMLPDALIRVGVILLTAALLNEPIAALEDARQSLPVRILRAPYDLMQHMTTLEPHPQMLEVAVCAFNAAMGNDCESPEDEAGEGEAGDGAEPSEE